MTEESLERGVENPRVVDLIELDEERGEVVLVVLEKRAWGTDPRQLHQLEDKVNSYLAYVLDGYLTEDHPQYEGLPVRFQLECETEPRAEEAGFMNALRNFCDTQKLGFCVRPRTERS